MKMIKSLLVLCGLMAVTATAKADIFDRIDMCERNGGGSCVYNLLRELAQMPTQSVGTLELGTYNQTSGTCCTFNTVVASGPGTLRINYCQPGNSGTFTCNGADCRDVNGYQVIINSSRSYTWLGNGRTCTYQK